MGAVERGSGSQGGGGIMDALRESMAEGVPMICTPFFSDQMGNVRYV